MSHHVTLKSRVAANADEAVEQDMLSMAEVRIYTDDSGLEGTGGGPRKKRGAIQGFALSLGHTEGAHYLVLMRRKRQEFC